MACGIWRAMASIRPSVCSATATALSPGMFMTKMPAAGGGVEVDEIGSHAGEGDDAEFLRGLDLGGGDFGGARGQQDFGVGQMLRVFGGAGGDDFPAGLRSQKVDARCTQRFRDYDFHGSLNRHWLFFGGVMLLDCGDAGA